MGKTHCTYIVCPHILSRRIVQVLEASEFRVNLQQSCSVTVLILQLPTNIFVSFFYHNSCS